MHPSPRDDTSLHDRDGRTDEYLQKKPEDIAAAIVEEPDIKVMLGELGARKTQQEMIRATIADLIKQTNRPNLVRGYIWYKLQESRTVYYFVTGLTTYARDVYSATALRPYHERSTAPGTHAADEVLIANATEWVRAQEYPRLAANYIAVVPTREERGILVAQGIENRSIVVDPARFDQDAA